ncbi:MAG: TIGR00645 family protein [Pseudorhodoplanes sp.]|nr:TIGR00645 family protein [Pseudorhodoplanes sp.]
MRFENGLERFLFNSRWLLAPFYVGLVLALALLLYHFVVEFFHFAVMIPRATEREVILGILALIDLSFTANLVLIVIFSGYENFVSKMEIKDHDRPDWMTKVDFGGLKQKLMTSIVAISAIEVLKGFMNIEKFDTDRLAWLVGIHGVFLGSLLVVVIADRISEPMKHPAETASGRARRKPHK